MGLDARAASGSFGRTASTVFDPSFDPRLPEVQEYLAEVCRKFPNGTGLQWRGTATGEKEGVNWCFMEHFKNYVKTEGYSFPVPFYKFDQLVDKMVKYHTYFAQLVGRPEGYPNNKNNRSLFFIAAKYKINIRTQDASQVSQPVFNAWTDFTNKINADAPAGT